MTDLFTAPNWDEEFMTELLETGKNLPSPVQNTIKLHMDGYEMLEKSFPDMMRAMNYLEGRLAWSNSYDDFMTQTTIWHGIFIWIF